MDGPGLVRASACRRTRRWLLPLSHYYEVMRICAQCLCESIVTSSVCIRSTGLTVSYGNSSFHFSNCRTNSQSGSANLQASHRPQRKAPISPWASPVPVVICHRDESHPGGCGRAAGRGKATEGGPAPVGRQTPLPPPFHTRQLTLASGPDLGEAEAESCSHVWEGYEKKNPCWPKHLNKNYTGCFVLALTWSELIWRSKKGLFYCYCCCLVFESELLNTRIQREITKQNTCLKSIKWY